MIAFNASSTEASRRNISLNIYLSFDLILKLKDQVKTQQKKFFNVDIRSGDKERDWKMKSFGVSKCVVRS